MYTIEDNKSLDDNLEEKMRKKNIILPLAGFLSGFLLYGLIGAVTSDRSGIMRIDNAYLYILLVGLLGGYLIFSIINGIMLTVKWVSNRTLKQKIALAVFWLIPLYSVMLGLFYSIPYFVYNCIKYMRSPERGKEIRKALLIIVIIFILALALIFGIRILVGQSYFKTFTEVSDEKGEYRLYNTNALADEESIPDSDYYESLEEALKHSKPDGGSKYSYQKNIDEIIVQFENEDYISIYFRSVKDKDTETLTFAKFKKKMIGNEKKYVFLLSNPTEVKRGTSSGDNIKEWIKSRLVLSDYEQNVNIDPENSRFVYGDCTFKEIYSLKVEGQEPSNIIPYELFGETRYFWYYENIESNVEGSKLAFTLE